MNKLILKVFDVDYSFIIKNYLSPELWEKKWTLFEYKKFVITLELNSISTYDKKICFKVRITDNSKDGWNNTTYSYVLYSLNVDNLDILKKQINSTILGLMESFENNLYIKFSDAYKEISDLEDDEKDRLRELAKDFLDDNNVSNDDIREVYIDYFVDENLKINDMLNKYIEKSKYNYLTDLYLIFLKSINDEEKYNKVLSNCENENIESILEELKEYEEYMNTEEYEEDMKSNLKDI